MQTSIAEHRESVNELVINCFAQENSELRSHNESLQADLIVHRELLIATIDSLRYVTVELTQSREQKARITDEYRALRERLLGVDLVDHDEPPPARTSRHIQAKQTPEQVLH